MRPALPVLLALTACQPLDPARPEATPDGAGLRIGEAGMWVGFSDLAGLPAQEDPCAAFDARGVCLAALAWDRGDLVGWWRPLGAGWEQGWTVHAATGPELRLGVELPDVTLTEVHPARAGWVDAGGTEWWYDGLSAWDASGRAVPAHLEAAPGGLDVVVDLRGASLPVVIDPIVGTPTLIGNLATPLLSLSSGDLDGDGDDEVVWTDGNVNLAWSNGSAGTGPDGTPDGSYSIPGTSFGSTATSVSVGDLDGDGYDDIVVGAKDRGAGAFGNAGGVVVWAGSAAGPVSTTTELASVQSNGQTGASVAVIPDVNGDGYDDLAVGSPGVAAGNGRTYLVLGGSPLSLSYDAWYDGGSNAANGQYVTGADIDGDGVGELIASANERVFTYDYNGSTALQQSATYLFPPAGTSARFGRTVVPCDVNGDGYDDLVVGAPGTGVQVGHVHAFLGGPSRGTTPWFSIAGVVPSGEFGFDLACLGDSDGDGREDLAVGEPKQQTNRGRIYWFYSPATSNTALTSANAVNFATGPSSGELRGTNVASGDVDANGLPDILFSGVLVNKLYWYRNSDDGDSDGVPRATDCDDSDPAIGAPAALAYEDLDGDGVGGVGRTFCPGEPSVGSGGDCDDDDPTRYPGATEICDGDDEDCDGDIDEGLPLLTGFTDGDGDGIGAGAPVSGTCAARPGGTVTQGGDCDDTSNTVYPGATELCDSADQDCDGTADDGLPILTGYTDNDNDGFGAGSAVGGTCAPLPGGAVAQGGDCDDTTDTVYPGAAEVCDGADQDCDGTSDDGLPILTGYTDNDNDGFGAGSAVGGTCAPLPGGTVAQGGDCDDTSDTVYPGATERCDGADQDCDGNPDDGLPILTGYTDNDDDGFGAGSAVGGSCAPLPGGAVPQGGDCDDTTDTVYPGAAELCDGADQDCDGTADDGLPTVRVYPDLDEDGFGTGTGTDTCAAVGAFEATEGGDCDDSDGGINPDATEIVDDAIDQDCDGTAQQTEVPDDTEVPGDTDVAEDTELTDDTDEEPRDSLDPDDKAAGCACSASPSPTSGGWGLAGLALLLRRRRR